MKTKQQVFRYSKNLICFPLPTKKKGSLFTVSTNQGMLSMASTTFVPFGLYGRLALVALSEFALQADKDNRVNNISLYSVLKKIKGSKPTGKQLERFQENLIAWSTSLITLNQTQTDSASGCVSVTYRNLFVVDEAALLLKKDLEESKAYILFSQKGKEFFSSEMIPLPVAAIRRCNTSLEFDILAWIVYSSFLCQKQPECITFIPWKQIIMQFGISSKHHADFKKSFLQGVHQWGLYYPQIKISEENTEGFALRIPSLLVSEKDDAFFVPMNFTQGGMKYEH